MVVAAYPTASQVVLITDPDFAAGVVTQNGQVRGTLKGLGTPLCRVDYVPPEEKVTQGEWFYTSGDDRIFPRGFPVGIVKAVRDAQPPNREILVDPSGMARGLEDVLILIQGVHQPIPDTPSVNQSIYIAPPPPAEAGKPQEIRPPGAVPGTEADKLRAQYKAMGDAQGHKFGEGLPGSKPPDFNLKVPSAASQTAGTGSKAPAVQTPPAASKAPATPVQPSPAGSKPAESRAPAKKQPEVPPGGASRQ
jgi:rod shape-determining protein MreC